MKKTTTLLTGFLLAICFVACQKETLNTILKASKTSSIKKGEPVIFTLPPSAAGSSAKWSVNPSANTQINARGDSASILFGAKGNYTVTAAFGNSIATSSISVTDTASTDSVIYIPPTPWTTLSLVPGEVIKINVMKWPIARTDSSSTAALLLTERTTNSYNCGLSYLISEIIAGANSYTIKYSGVSVPANCNDGSENNYASGSNFLYPISDGTSTLTIVVNGTTYSGTIIKTDTNFIIDWPDTSVVTISPTSL